MVNSNTGVNFTVYANMITKYGDDVVRTPATQTLSNVDADETLTSGTPETIRVYICRRTKEYKQEEEGFFEGGDAIMLAKSTQTVNKNDLIAWQGETYLVFSVLDRDQIGGNIAYKKCVLFLRANA